MFLYPKILHNEKSIIYYTLLGGWRHNEIFAFKNHVSIDFANDVHVSIGNMSKTVRVVYIDGRKKWPHNHDKSFFVSSEMLYKVPCKLNNLVRLRDKSIDVCV